MEFYWAGFLFWFLLTVSVITFIAAFWKRLWWLMARKWINDDACCGVFQFLSFISMGQICSSHSFRFGNYIFYQQ